MCNPYERQIRFRRADFDKIPPNAFGVYGVWFGKRCLYVGKAENQPIAARLTQHWRSTHNPELADWLSAKGSELRVAYIAVDDKSKIHCMERMYIRRYQPLTNKTR